MYLPPILRTVKKRGAVVFTAGDYDLNLIAIRRGDNVDDLAVVYMVLGKWRVEWFTVSTEPTPQYLENPVNRKGAAILALGQHRGSHAAGLHRGRRALVQVGQVTVHRDNDGGGLLRDQYPRRPRRLGWLLARVYNVNSPPS